MITHAFFDLEDTVVTPNVDGWHTVELINGALMREYLGTIRPHASHVFSFALHDSHQRNLFNTHARGMIERELGVAFSFVPTVDEELLPICCKMKNLHPQRVDFLDITSFWGKQEVFRMFVRHMFGTNPQDRPHVKCVLFDDSVINEKFEYPDLNLSGEFIYVPEKSWERPQRLTY